MLGTYLGICPHDQVLQLDDFVIDGGAIPLLNDVVCRPSFSLFGGLELLDSPGNLLNGHLLLPHHHRHCGQNGPTAAHQGLEQAQTQGSYPLASLSTATSLNKPEACPRGTSWYPALGGLRPFLG